MAIRKFKPRTPSLRHTALLTSDELTKGISPEKSLLRPKKRCSGRNVHGRITVRRRGGGAKRKYRIVDFRRNKLDIPAKVAAIHYDPNRSANIVLLYYADGEKRYILAPLNLKVGDEVVSSDSADIKVGNAKMLKRYSRRYIGSQCRTQPRCRRTAFSLGWLICSIDGQRKR